MTAVKQSRSIPQVKTLEIDGGLYVHYRGNRSPRKFSPVGEEPYINRQGQSVGLILWESECVVCKTKFIVKHTKNGDPTKSRAFEIATCEQHRNTLPRYRHFRK